MKITVRRMVDIECTADDWGLYDMEDREVAAKYLSREFSFYATTHEKADCRHKMISILEEWSTYGAADTEGYNTMETILNQVYGA